MRHRDVELYQIALPRPTFAWGRTARVPSAVAVGVGVLLSPLVLCLLAPAILCLAVVALASLPIVVLLLIARSQAAQRGDSRDSESSAGIAAALMSTPYRGQRKRARYLA